ncbi:MAG: hypothetical protein K9H12_10860, partial [Bacteroidales bacterium]|nr:hypothetical protein [Bacteroidales bacterium]
LSSNIDRKFDYACLSMALHQFHTEQRATILEEALNVSDTLIIADYNLNLPKGFFKWLVFLIERMAGKEHYSNFLSFRKEGGVEGIINKNNYLILSEVKASSEVFSVFRVSKKNGRT